MGFDLIDIPGTLVGSGRIDSFCSCLHGLQLSVWERGGIALYAIALLRLRLCAVIVMSTRIALYPPAYVLLLPRCLWLNLFTAFPWWVHVMLFRRILRCI